MGSNFNNFQLKTAYWIFIHRPLFRKILVGIVIFINFLIWGFVVYQFSLYLIFWQAHQQTLKGLVEEKIDFLAYHQRIAATPLKVSNLLALPIGQTNRYDLLAEIENQNSYWGVRSLEYRFIWSTGKTDFYSGYILPQERKYLFILNQQSIQPIQNIQIEIKNIQWQRIKETTNLLLKIPSQIMVEDLTLSSVSSTKNPWLSLIKLRFKIYNDSVYDLGSFRLNLLFYSGSQIIGVDQLTVKDLKNRSAEFFDLILSDYLSRVDRVKIIPDLNIFDPEIFANSVSIPD